MELATQIEKVVVDLKGMTEDELYNFYGDNNTLAGYGILRDFPRVVRHRMLRYTELLAQKLHYTAIECPAVAKWCGKKAAAELGLIRRAVRHEVTLRTACETVMEPSTVDPSHGTADSHVQAYESECMTRQRQTDIDREYRRYSEACMVAGRLNMLQDATQARWYVATVRPGVWKLTTDIKKVLAGVTVPQETAVTSIRHDTQHGQADSHVQAFDRHVEDYYKLPSGSLDGLPEVDLACMVCSRTIEPESYSDCLCCGCIDAGYAIFWHEGTPTVLPSALAGN